jgi:hypothetical protein
MSPVDPRAMQNETTDILEFNLPPPLNAYVYPVPLYICKHESGSPASLSIAEFVELCSQLGELAQKTEVTEAVYDVPAIPFANTDFDEQYDDESEDELENDSEDEACTESDEDDEWEIDDEEAVVLPS